jgi:hypothetical protein
MSAQNIPIRVVKDVALIQTKLDAVEMSFESGLRLMGPRNTFPEHVTIEHSTEGQATKVEILDKVKTLKGK